MKYNHDMEWYEEDIDGITYMIEDYINEEEAKKEIAILDKWLEDNLDKTVKNAIAEKLLELKNHQWLSGGEKEYTLEEMAQNITLSEVGITEKKVELYFKENGMFDNNSITINLDKIGESYAYYNVNVG